MRLLTRSDFDGLICAVLLKKMGVIDNWVFVHPKDLQDGLVPVTEDDCLANVPFVPGCGLWFDHHMSELERGAFKGQFKGASHPAPSAARVIYDYYGAENFSQYDEMMAAVDKVDSGNLTCDEIKNPTGWILLGFMMDPRTGLGRFRSFTIPNYMLMEKLIDWCAVHTIDEILALPDLKERIELYNSQTEEFVKMVKEHTTIRGDVIISDLRGVETIYTGNRFMIYSLYPEQNISVWIVDGKGKQGCSAAVGHSILNRTSTVNVGALMLKYGGGGHPQVGTCQFPSETMDKMLPLLLDEICAG